MSESFLHLRPGMPGGSHEVHVGALRPRHDLQAMINFTKHFVQLEKAVKRCLRPGSMMPDKFMNWFMLRVRLSSYGCTRGLVGRAREKRKSSTRRSLVQLQLRECSPNFPSFSVVRTQWNNGHIQNRHRSSSEQAPINIKIVNHFQWIECIAWPIPAWACLLTELLLNLFIAVTGIRSNLFQTPNQHPGSALFLS